MGQWTMLTYLDCPASQHFGKRAHGFPAIALMATDTLAIQFVARFAPGQIVYDA
jgi:hypothetical protein